MDREPADQTVEEAARAFIRAAAESPRAYTAEELAETIGLLAARCIAPTSHAGTEEIGREVDPPLVKPRRRRAQGPGDEDPRAAPLA